MRHGEVDLRDLQEHVLLRAKDIRFRRVGAEAVVLAQDAGEVLVVNEVGARILELADGETPVKDWLRVLEAEYDVPAAALQEDVARYLDELLEKGVFSPIRS